MDEEPEIQTKGGAWRGFGTLKAPVPASRCSKTFKHPQASISATKSQIQSLAITRPPYSPLMHTPWSLQVWIPSGELSLIPGVLPALLSFPPSISKTQHVCFSQRGNAFWPCLAVVFHWQTAECSVLCFSSIQAANFRLVFFFFFFPVLESVLNSQRETEGRQDIPTQEKEMPAITCYASWTLKSPVLGCEWLTKH